MATSQKRYQVAEGGSTGGIIFSDSTNVDKVQFTAFVGR